VYFEPDGVAIGMASGGSASDLDSACIETAFEQLLLQHLVPIMRARQP
jgi:hypothetical protein